MSYRSLFSRPLLHEDSIWSVCWSNSHLITAGAEPAIRFWNLETPLTSDTPSYDSALKEPVQQYGDLAFISCISLCTRPQQKNQVWSSWMDGKLRLLDCSSPASGVSELLTIDAGSGKNWTLSHHPKESIIATGSNNGTITLFQYNETGVTATRTLSAGAESSTASAPASSSSTSTPAAAAASSAGQFVYSVAFSPDGTTIAAGLSDGSLLIFDIITGKLKDRMQSHSQAIRALAWSTAANGSVTTPAALEGGNLLFSGSDDTYLNGYDTRTNQQTIHLQGHSGWITSLHWLSNGTQVLSTSADRKTKVWDIRANIGMECVHTFENNNAIVWNAAIHDNGKIVVTVAEDGSIAILQVK